MKEAQSSLTGDVIALTTTLTITGLGALLLRTGFALSSRNAARILRRFTK